MASFWVASGRGSAAERRKCELYATKGPGCRRMMARMVLIVRVWMSGGARKVERSGPAARAMWDASPR
jgi:hypothetical protein